MTHFTEEFIDANRLRFPVHGDKVDFPRFDFEFGQAVAVFVDDEIGAVDFVYALQARRNIYGVSDDGEGFCGGGADGANQRIACGQGHPDMKLRNVSAESSDLRNILFDLSKGGAHFQAGEAGIARVILPFGKRSGPKGHDGVSDELIHDSVMLTDAGGGGGKVVIEESDNIVSGELLSDTAKAGDIGKEDGNFSAVG